MTLLRNFALGSLALAASLAANAAGFQNGSFETGNWTAGGDTQFLTPVDTSMTGWTSYGLQWDIPGSTVRTGDVAWLNCAGGCWTDLTPQQGNKFVDLTGGDASRYGAIYQTFDTTIGQEYEVSFYVGKSNTWTLPGNSANLYAMAAPGSAGIVSDSITAGWQLYSNDTHGWAQATFSFVATEATSSLFFAGGYDSNHYIGLDNVSVTAVPEPETYAMMLAGLAAIGSIARRRKAK